MCCGKTYNQQVLNSFGELVYKNYVTFDYVPEMELVALKLVANHQISVTTIHRNRVTLNNAVPYAIVTKEEAQKLLSIVKRGVRYFTVVPKYQINIDGMFEEIK